MSLYPDRLDWTQQEIRLVQISPRKDLSSEIELSFHHVSLLRKPSYIALSYAWGSQVDRQTVRLDGQELLITVNLNDALLELRSQQENESDLPRLFWIDQLSINQEDVIEKETYVKQMGIIYREAEFVVTWLGPAGHESGAVLSGISQIASYAKEQGIDGYSTIIHHQDRTETSFDDKITSQIMLSPILQGVNWYALHEFLSRQWWKRAWVVQEIAMAEHAVLLCGSSAIAWAEMTRFLACVEICVLRAQFVPITDLAENTDLRQRTAEISALTGPFLKMPFFHKTMQKEDANINLGDVLNVTALSNNKFRQVSTDPRDQIYSRLALIKYSDRAQITVRYDEEWTSRKLFAQVTEILFRQEGLYLLQFAGLGEDTDRSAWPTWILDFDSPTANWTSIIQELGCFYASGLSGRNIYHFRIDLDNETLYTAGGCVDSIQSVGSQFPHAHFSIEHEPDLSTHEVSLKHIEELRAWLNDFKALATSQERVYDAEDLARIDEAIVRTCVMDCFGKGVSAEIYEGYRAIVKQIECPSDTDADAWLLKVATAFVHNSHIRNRTPFMTSAGYFGTARLAVQANDIVALIRGVDTPFVLRPLNDGRHQLKGEAHVHGIMFGEIFIDEENQNQWETVTIC